MFTDGQTRFKRTDRECWALVLKYEGETVYYADGKEFISAKESPTLLPRGSSYDWICTHAGRFMIVEFDAEGSMPTPVTLHSSSHEELLRALRELEKKCRSTDSLSSMECIRDLYSIFISLSRVYDRQYTPSEKSKKIAPAHDYIVANFDKTPTLDMLAKMCGISAVYFRKLFLEIYGVAPLTYARTLRIEKAKQMLGTDYGTLGDIAESLGYQSLYDFSRDFKKHTGVAPSKYK